MAETLKAFDEASFAHFVESVKAAVAASGGNVREDPAFDPALAEAMDAPLLEGMPPQYGSAMVSILMHLADAQEAGENLWQYLEDHEAGAEELLMALEAHIGANVGVFLTGESISDTASLKEALGEGRDGTYVLPIEQDAAHLMTALDEVMLGPVVDQLAEYAASSGMSLDQMRDTIPNIVAYSKVRGMSSPSGSGGGGGGDLVDILADLALMSSAGPGHVPVALDDPYWDTVREFVTAGGGGSAALSSIGIGPSDYTALLVTGLRPASNGLVSLEDAQYLDFDDGLDKRFSATDIVDTDPIGEGITYYRIYKEPTGTLPPCGDLKGGIAVQGISDGAAVQVAIAADGMWARTAKVDRNFPPEGGTFIRPTWGEWRPLGGSGATIVETVDAITQEDLDGGFGLSDENYQERIGTRLYVLGEGAGETMGSQSAPWCMQTVDVVDMSPLPAKLLNVRQLYADAAGVVHNRQLSADLSAGADSLDVNSDDTLATTAQLPKVATTKTAGLVKPDGETVTVDESGVLSALAASNVVTVGSDNCDLDDCLGMTADNYKDRIAQGPTAYVLPADGSVAFKYKRSQSDLTSIKPATVVQVVGMNDGILKTFNVLQIALVGGMVYKRLVEWLTDYGDPSKAVIGKWSTLISSSDVAKSNTKAGIVKPDGETIDVDSSGTISVDVAALAKNSSFVTALASNQAFVDALVAALPVVSTETNGLAPKIPEA